MHDLGRAADLWGAAPDRRNLGHTTSDTRENTWVPRSSRGLVRRLSSYGLVLDQIDLGGALLAGLERSDLLPPRPDDRAGGEVGDRFIAALKRALANGTYEPFPALLVPVPKPKYSTRPAALLNLSDRVLYHALVEPLRSRIERRLVSKQALFWPRADEVDKRWSEFEHAPLSVEGTHIIRADVSGFYESIDHELLGDRLTTLTGKTDLVTVLIEFLGQIMSQPRGLPQGLVTSDALATAYLSSLDAAMLRRTHYYWRHGDDIRVTVASHGEGRSVVHYIEEQLRAARLLLNAEKTWVLKRATYERQLGAVDKERARVQDALIEKREQGLLDVPDEEIVELVQSAGVDEETQWDLFYHGNVSLQDIVDQLRPLLKPNQVEVAVATYDEAMRRAPDGNADDKLSSEMFHGLLTTSFTPLIASRNPYAIKDAATLVRRFPDKTELVATYLRALAASSPDDVAREAIVALASGYLTGWQQAWLLQVVREVVATGTGTDVTDGMTADEAIANAEDESWLARAEAARLLAHRGCLSHDLLSRLWARAPVAVHADLAAAVVAATRSTDPPPAWAEAFLDSLAAEPMLQVVLARARETGSTTGAPQPSESAQAAVTNSTNAG